MANEFKIKKGLIVDGDSTFSGSLESTQAVTASFFTGSFSGDGTNLTGITAEWDGSHNGDAEITGSLVISGSSVDLTVEGDVNITDGNRLNIESPGGTYTGYIEKVSYNATVNLGLTTTFTGIRKLITDDGTNQRWQIGGNSTATTDNFIAPGSSYNGSSIYAGHLGSIGFYSIGSTSNANVMELFDRTDNSNHGVKLIYKSGGSYSDGLMLDNTGNVGIGTTSPTGRNGYGGQKVFEVYNASSYASINVTGNGSTFGTIGAQSSGVDLRSSGPLRFGSNGNNTRMTIDTSGNIGIGQTSPSARLNVKGSGATSATTALLVENSSGTDLLKITDDGLVTIPSALEHDGDSGTGLHFPSNDTISLKINGTEGLHINSTRNIGIGTTSPSEKLHVAGDLKVEGDLHLEGDLDFRVINSSGFGQPGIELPNFIDTFWRADRRFTLSVTGGQSVAGIKGLFDGTYANLINFAASSTHVITINVANQSGVGVNGYTYPQGYIYFSFYSSTNDYDSISGRVKDKDGNYNSMTGLTDIISNDATYKVMRLTVPANNYAVEFELTLVTNTNNVRLAAINYISTRHLASQMELPYVAKTQDINRLFGNIDVLTSTGGDQNRISGTGDSYLAVDTGDVGIGTSSPVEKLTVEGNISGSGDLTIDGTFNGDGSGLTGISAEWDGTRNGDAEITGSLTVTGDTGIGIDSPTARLNVKGAGTTSGTNALLVENSSGTDLLQIRDDGHAVFNYGVEVNNLKTSVTKINYINTFNNAYSVALTDGTDGSINFLNNVGIGVTNPTEKLEVAGKIKTSGTSGDIDTSRSFLLSTLGTSRGGVYSDQILTGDVADSLDDVVLYSANGAIHLTEGSTTNKVLTVSGSAVGIGTETPEHTLEVNGDFKIKDSLVESYQATGLSSGAHVIAALSTTTHPRVGMFVDYSIYETSGNSTRAGRVMIASNGTSITSTDNSTADIGNTAGAIWSAVINGASSTIDVTLTVPATGNWDAVVHVTSM